MCMHLHTCIQTLHHTQILRLQNPLYFSQTEETMLSIEEILCEIHGEVTNEQGLPPGFRFHPTDEELVTFYLASKVLNGSFCGVDIAEVDLNRCEPWELPDTAKIGEREWYFFSLRDRKYPTGLRTNRATEAGYWKATGKDKEIYSTSSNKVLLGMKKTLVFYKGRAPRGEKTKWVMHEYRLVGDFSSRHRCNKDEWVICRIYHKVATEKKNPLSHIHNYILKASSSHSNILPPLLETPSSAAQTLSFNHHETELKHLIEQPHQSLFSSIAFQPSFSDNKINTTSPSESIFIKSLFSHPEEYTDILPRQWKETTTTNFSHFQQVDASAAASAANMQWVDKIHQTQTQSQNNLFFEMGCGISAYATAAADTTVHDMSTSVAFNRDGFQSLMMMDSHFRGLGESGALDA